LLVCVICDERFLQTHALLLQVVEPFLVFRERRVLLVAPHRVLEGPEKQNSHKVSLNNIAKTDLLLAFAKFTPGSLRIGTFIPIGSLGLPARNAALKLLLPMASLLLLAPRLSFAKAIIVTKAKLR
jgi:hypothetical protein